MSGERKPTVLIIEDQNMNRQILRQILGTEYEVLEAENGERAFAILRERDGISAILLDLMLMALETGTVDFICTDMPTAQGAVIAYPDMTILDFSKSSDDFQVSDEDVNIGISVMKGNTYLKDALNSVLSKMTADDFNSMMAQATKIQPVSNG